MRINLGQLHKKMNVVQNHLAGEWDSMWKKLMGFPGFGL